MKSSAFVAVALVGCNSVLGLDDRTLVNEDAGASGGTSGMTEPASTGATAGAASGGVTASSGSSSSGNVSTGSPSMSGVPMGSGSSAPSGTASGETAASGTTMGSDAADASTPPEASEPLDASFGDVNRVCVPGPASGQLPFVVDSEYQPTGSFGTGTTSTSMACTVARSSVTAKGNCHTATYTVVAGGAFAGVFWQYNFNWGAEGGYQIPAGATKITFSAMGAAGGEKVSFIAGVTGAPTPATPCTDTIRANTNTLTLTTSWTAYSMALSGGYPEGVLGAFGWEANAPDAAGTGITFYVDDIQYQ